MKLSFNHLLISFLLVMQVKSHAQNLDSILNNYYSKTGGIKNWKSLKSVVIRYKNVSLKGMSMMHVSGFFSNSYNSSHAIKINSKKNDTLICEKWIILNEKNPNDTFSTSYNGENYWIHKKGKTPESFLDYTKHYGRHVRMSEPLLLLSSDSIKLDGIKKLDSYGKLKDCFRVKVFIDGSETHY